MTGSRRWGGGISAAWTMAAQRAVARNKTEQHRPPVAGHCVLLSDRRGDPAGNEVTRGHESHLDGTRSIFSRSISWSPRCTTGSGNGPHVSATVGSAGRLSTMPPAPPRHVAGSKGLLVPIRITRTGTDGVSTKPEQAKPALSTRGAGGAVTVPASLGSRLKELAAVASRFVEPTCLLGKNKKRCEVIR